jgi:predicted N-acyltransferase
MPLYLKSHSWGEFVFDFAWAEAYQRAGLRYYPRLVSAVPFTPVTGPRLLVTHDDDQEATRRALIAAARELARELAVSSMHVLFPEARDRPALEAATLLPRLDCQFHWHNQGFGSFDDFLAGFTAEKRKKVRRERRRVAEAGITFMTLHGGELDRARIATIHRLHAETFARHGTAPYLNADFFDRIARAMPESLVIELAMLRGEAIACSVSLRGRDTLYGRYWGTDGDHHSLHFETCYYRGIEYCIRERLAIFEPGTQVEHKLARGFVPTAVWSMHDILEPRFAAAIGNLARSQAHSQAGLRVPPEGICPSGGRHPATRPMMSGLSGCRSCPAGGCATRAQRTKRPACGRRRTDSGVADSRLPARGVSVVLVRSADTLVGARSARRAGASGVPDCPESRALHPQARL